MAFSNKDKSPQKAGALELRHYVKCDTDHRKHNSLGKTTHKINRNKSENIKLSEKCKHLLHEHMRIYGT